MKNRVDRGAETSYNIHYKQNLKRHDTDELTYQIEKVSQTQRMNLWLPEGRMGEGIVREFGTDIAVSKMDNQSMVISP